MTAGTSLATRLHRPQVAAVPMREPRAAAGHSDRQFGPPTSRLPLANPVAMRAAAAATPPLAAPPAGGARIGRMLARSLMFALALIASAAAGAGVTLLLSGARPGPSRVDAVFAELPAPGQ